MTVTEGGTTYFIEIREKPTRYQEPTEKVYESRDIFGRVKRETIEGWKWVEGTQYAYEITSDPPFYYAHREYSASGWGVSRDYVARRIRDYIEEDQRLRHPTVIEIEIHYGQGQE